MTLETSRMSSDSKLRLASSGPGAAGGAGGLGFTKVPVPGKTFGSMNVSLADVFSAAAAAAGATSGDGTGSSSLRSDGGRSAEHDESRKAEATATAIGCCFQRVVREAAMERLYWVGWLRRARRRASSSSGVIGWPAAWGVGTGFGVACGTRLDAG